MSAKVLNLFNTGVDDSGRLLPAGSVDPHYQIITPAPAAQAFVCKLDPTWGRNTPTAQWISPSANNKGNQARYEYETKFVVQDLRLISNIQISGRWAADDQGAEVRLNGQVQPNVTQCSFRAFAGFTIDTGFQNGVNTLVFLVNNALPVVPDPTGLLVQFDPLRVSEEQFEYEYVAKLVIGKQAERENMMLARGFYATIINIHNPNYGPVRIYKKLALTFPPVEEKPGKIYDIAIDKLEHDEALKVDGNEIQRLLFPGGLPAPGHVEGFVVIQSHASLDVVAVYTTAVLDDNGKVTEHSAIDLIQVLERHRPSAPPKGKEGGKRPFLLGVPAATAKSSSKKRRR